jgi:DNA processing protein
MPVPAIADAVIVPTIEPAAPPPETRSPEDIRALHQRILDRLGPSPLAEDQLIRDLALPAAAITPELVNLELDGLIQRQPGGLINRLN